MQSSVAFRLTDRRRDATIAFNADGPVRVDRFLSQVSALADNLPAGRYVLNLLSDRYQYLVGFCASAVAGRCTLMPPNRSPGTLEQLLADYPTCCVLDDNDGSLSVLSRSGDAALDTPRVAGDRLAAIAFTSGSTGKPKANLKYWSTLRDGSMSNAKLLLGDMSERLNLVATVPPQHMWGLEMSILLPLFSETAVSYRTPFFPGDILEALENVPGPRGLVSSPVHLEALLRSDPGPVALERIFTATAPLSAAFARELASRLDTDVVDVFGCSECGVIAARNPSYDSDWLLADAFDLLPEREGTVVSARHLPEAVVMPDVVRKTGEKRFTWLGRHQDMVNVAGKRGSLAEMNQRLKEMPDVIDGIVFKPEESERLAAMVVAPDLSAGEVLAYLGKFVDPLLLPRPLYFVPQLPRQETGKLTRAAVLELFSSLRRADSRAKSPQPGRTG